ncbi:SDR family NAD(P)-dependent oxidoreductase [Gorillibacterium sp. sgz500922]|uniref:SDR family NAD(P)-dependent oxidoreductase n=1 Tax=Gorillibacterium sp. sgz500922 TaxID=3446694 RepID=UPI003F679271
MDQLYTYILKQNAEGKLNKEIAIQMISLLRQQEKTHSHEDIAIIGMAAHFPEADTVSDYYENILAGVGSVGEFPSARQAGVNDYVTAQLERMGMELRYHRGSYLEDVASFDYGFFRMSPNEASALDPSQRLFLQTVWEAIEDAGYGGRKLSGTKTGVYVGFASNSSYHNMIFDMDPDLVPIALAGNIAAMLPTRISYMLDLKGPTLILDTACSSALVAVHLACQAIRSGDCSMALAGGIKIHLFPAENPGLQLGVEAADGMTRSFDADAGGAGLGEGVAAMMLKPLSKAQRDGDPIYAVIKGSAVNQDGTSIGITAPNSTAQAEVIMKAWENARIEPETIRYVEAHGTATKLGDPLEVEGLQKAFRKFTDKKQFCALSTAKTNVGHLYECAGMAGLIKAVMALNHQTIPASLSFTRPNRNIEFCESPLYLNTVARPWDKEPFPRRCGVSGFGLSGTNCHVVLEEYIQETSEPSLPEEGPQLLALSARSEGSLRGLLSKYHRFLCKAKDLQAADLCYTANTGRGHYNHRLLIVFQGLKELKQKVKWLLEHHIASNEEQGIFYGEHVVISANRTQLSAKEIKDSDKAQLTQEAACQLQAYRASNKEDTSSLWRACALYTQGAELKWEELYPDRKPRKIHAPTYAFDKNKCWIRIPESKRSLDQEKPAFYYKMKWRPQAAGEGRRLDKAGVTLLLKDNGGVGSAIQEAYRCRGEEVIEVQLGRNDDPNSGSLYFVDGTRESYDKLFETLSGQRISRIIHLFSFNERGETAQFVRLDERLRAGLYSMLYLVQAMAKAGIQDEAELIAVTEYAASVTGQEVRVIPDNASLYGIGKVIGKEHPNLQCRFIDVDEATSIQHLLEELDAGYTAYAVAYRENERYTEVFTELDVSLPDAGGSSIKEQGVYVITGGTGGIGLEVAKYFAAAQNKVHLALLNRRPVPARDAWQDLLDREPAGKTAKTIRALKELEAAGAVVECLSVDVSNLEAMGAVLAQLRCTYGAINGIVHAAGVSNDGPMANRSPELTKAILAPKIHGTWVLDSLTQEDELDFMILFSSVATYFSAYGQGEYAAANAYLDAYSAYRSRKGKRTTTINWTTWKETGMAADSGHVVDTIFKTLATPKGIEGFHTLLCAGEPSALVGEINYGGVGSMLLERSGVPCSDSIMRKLVKKEGKPRRSITDEDQGSRKTDVVLQGREAGDYTDIERLLAQVCMNVLGFKEVNIQESFFEMGADSLLLMRIQGEVDQHYPGAVSVTDLFEYTSIHQLAELLEERAAAYGHRTKYPPLTRLEEQETYPASYNQTRMFLAYRKDPLSTSLNQYRVSLMEFPVDARRLEDAIRQAIARHEVLRTSLHVVDGQIVQRVSPAVDFTLEYYETEGRSPDSIINGFKRPFQLHQAPLFRAGLIKLEEEKFLLLYDAHHVITDGVSTELFMKDMSRLYLREPLPELPFQYKDYAAWQHQCMEMDFMKQQASYWHGVYQDGPPLLQMPTDYRRPEVLVFEGRMASCYTSRELAERLKKLASGTGTTLYMVLLAAYNVLLHKYSAQEDLVVGSPISGRPIPELEHIAGACINMLAMRGKPAKTKVFSTFLEEMKEHVLQAFEHQDYPFDELINRLGLPRGRNRHPLFDTLFILQNVVVDNSSSELFHSRPSGHVYNLADYDLTMEAVEAGGCIRLNLEYCTKLFKQETAERLLSDYVGILEAVAECADVAIQDIELPSSRLHTPHYEDEEDVEFSL